MSVRRILDKAAGGQRISVAEAEALFRANGSELDDVVASADQIRRTRLGDDVTFAVNRNINFTNVCYMGCRFCNFGKRVEDPDAHWLPLTEIVARAREAMDRGATEVCIQGGLHPKMEGTLYRDIVLALKAALPDLHIHAFSPFEIWYGAQKRRMSYADFVEDLMACGLGSMPGTAAEILDTEIRQQLTRNKLSAEAWEEIIRTAHGLGLPTTATIMYGHIDGPEHWAAHLGRLRDIQDDTGGFTELVPLSFVHEDAPLYRDNPTRVRPGPTRDEVTKMHAVARIFLAGSIDNIQVSWTKLGPERAVELLNAGVNDLGGTLMNESISRAAGARHGQEITAAEIVQMVRRAGRVPVQRNTVYQTVERFDDHDPVELAPLVDRKGQNPLDFMTMFPDLPAAE